MVPQITSPVLAGLLLSSFIPARVSGRAVSPPPILDGTASLTYLDGSAVHGARSRRADNVKGDTSGMKMEFTYKGTDYSFIARKFLSLERWSLSSGHLLF